MGATMKTTMNTKKNTKMKTTMKTTTRAIVRVAALVCWFAYSVQAGADVLEVNIWKPNQGQMPEAMALAKEARGIHEKNGGKVTVGSDLAGRLHYAMAAKNWSAWNTIYEKTLGGDQWPSFIAKAQKNPVMELEENYLLNEVVSGKLGKVIQAVVWDPLPGKLGDLIEGATEAKAIHEKGGADVAIMVDQLNRMHYVMSFDSWKAWATFNDTPQEEFQQFLARRSQNPSGKIVRNYTVSIAD